MSVGALTQAVAGNMLACRKRTEVVRLRVTKEAQMKRWVIAVVVSFMVVGLAQAGVVGNDGYLHFKLPSPTRLPNSAEWTVGSDFVVTKDVMTAGVTGQYALKPGLALNASLALFSPDVGMMDSLFSLAVRTCSTRMDLMSSVAAGSLFPRTAMPTCGLLMPTCLDESPFRRFLA